MVTFRHKKGKCDSFPELQCLSVSSSITQNAATCLGQTLLLFLAPFTVAHRIQFTILTDRALHSQDPAYVRRPDTLLLLSSPHTCLKARADLPT